MSATQDFEACRATARKLSRQMSEYHRVLSSRRASTHEKQFARQQLDQMRATAPADRAEWDRLRFLAEVEAVPLASAILATIRAYPDAERALVERALQIVEEYTHEL